MFNIPKRSIKTFRQKPKKETKKGQTLSTSIKMPEKKLPSPLLSPATPQAFQ